MRDNFLLLELFEASATGLLAFPIATATGANPGFTLLTVLVFAVAPGLILHRFATDFSSGTTYSPNKAARVLHVTEFIRSSLCCWAVASTMMLPVGWILGLSTQPLAVFILLAGAIFCFVTEFTLSLIHRLICKKVRSE